MGQSASKMALRMNLLSSAMEVKLLVTELLSAERIEYMCEYKKKRCLQGMVVLANQPPQEN